MTQSIWSAVENYTVQTLHTPDPVLDAALAACACSADWNATEAARWWARPASPAVANEPTATFHKPEAHA